MKKVSKEKELKEEILRRIRKINEDVSVLGTELKSRRLSLSRTLCSISHQICSISYLSKLEHNKINPNRMYINEISDKLSLSKQAVEMLMNSKSLLIDVVKAYFEKDMVVLEQIYKECEGLNNYRMILVRLIVEVSLAHYDKARAHSAKLMELLTSMNELDLYVFSLFEGIIHFYNYEFGAAYECLDILRYCPIKGVMILIRINISFLHLKL